MLSIQVRERINESATGKHKPRPPVWVLNKTAILRKLEQFSVQCQDRNQSIGLLLAQIGARGAENSGTQELDSMDHLILLYNVLREKIVYARLMCWDALVAIFRHCSRLWRGRLLRVADRIVVTFSAPMHRF